MTNWKALVAARGLDISDDEVDRIQPMLDKLESVFEPLTARIPFGTEPVIVAELDEPMPVAEISPSMPSTKFDGNCRTYPACPPPTPTCCAACRATCTSRRQWMATRVSIA